MLTDRERGLVAYYDQRVAYASPLRQFLLADFLDAVDLDERALAGPTLDLAAGDGRLSSRRRVTSGPLDGFDISAKRIAAARRQHSRRYRRLLVGDVYDPPEELTPPYRLIFASEILEHLDDPHAVLERYVAGGWLDSDGWLVATVPVAMVDPAHLQVWDDPDHVVADLQPDRSALIQNGNRMVLAWAASDAMPWQAGEGELDDHEVPGSGFDAIVDGISGYTVDEVLTAVGGDVDRASRAWSAEANRSHPRSTLVDALDRIVNGPPE